MPLLHFNIRYSGPVPGAPYFGRPVWNNMLKEAWAATGQHWFDKLLPKHFTVAGGKEYGYAPRAGEAAGTTGKAFWSSYAGRKQKYKGHRDPLVWSGELRRDTLAQRSIYATFRGVRVALPGARKANFIPGEKNKRVRQAARNWRQHVAAVRGWTRASQVDMPDELTRVSPREIDELIGVHNEWMARRLGLVSEQCERAA
jgi:hypothetical protein